MRTLLGARGGESYADLLQQSPPEQGVEAEAARALAAENGVAEMLYDLERFVPGREGARAACRM